MGWMMAGMLTQLPLPLLPAGAAEIAPGVGLVTGAGGGGLVSVHGLATLPGMPGMRLNAGWPRCNWSGCARSAGSGRGGVRVDPVTVWRWDQALAADGVAGWCRPGGGRRGPRSSPRIWWSGSPGAGCGEGGVAGDRRGDRGVHVERA